jgi:phosphopantetheinyl transferase (holo-ACP synthase)
MTEQGFPLVGNDVVDLGLVRGRADAAALRERLAKRILTPEEASLLRRAGEGEVGELLTWALWAAKETAFKVHTKQLGEPPVFEHRSYSAHVELRPPGEAKEGEVRELLGWVRGPAFEIPLVGCLTPRFLHLAGQLTPASKGSSSTPLGHTLETGVECLEVSEPLAPHAPDSPPLPRPDGIFTDREWASIRSELSARVRILAKARIEGYLRRREGEGARPPSQDGSPRVEILTDPQNPGRRPPTVWIDGRLAREIDLSLSHHGRCAAWALLLPNRKAGTQEPG